MFDLKKIENGRQNVPEPEYLVCNATVAKGAACTLNASGKLVTGTTKPTYIALAGGKANETIPVCRVEPNQVYEVPTTTVASALVAGSKVAINSDAVQVSGTASESGVATVVSANGATAVGDKILVRFA